MTPAIQLSYKTSTEPDRAGAHVPVMWSIWLGWKEKGTETGTKSGSLIALAAGNEPLNEVRGNFATTTRGRRKTCSVRPITAFNQMGRQAENDSLGLGGFQWRPQVAGASLNLLAWQPQCSFFPNSTFTASPKWSSHKKICLIFSVHQEAFHCLPHICCFWLCLFQIVCLTLACFQDFLNQQHDAFASRHK